MKRLSIVFTCDSEPIGLYEIERRLRTAGFTRPQAGSIMDAELWFSGKPYEQAAALAICRSCPVIGECRRPPTSTTGSTATSCRASGAAADTGSNDDPRKDQQ